MPEMATLKNIEVKRILHCGQIVPTENPTATSAAPCHAHHSKAWKSGTIAFHLTKEQAIELATGLLVASQEMDQIWVTAFRATKRKDGTHPLTITGRYPEEISLDPPTV
jgi:hypothetical protein